MDHIPHQLIRKTHPWAIEIRHKMVPSYDCDMMASDQNSKSYEAESRAYENYFGVIPFETTIVKIDISSQCFEVTQCTTICAT